MATKIEKSKTLKNYKNILSQVNKYVSLSIDADKIELVQQHRKNAIELLQNFVDCLEITDYLLINSKPQVPEDIYCDSYFTLGTLYKSFVETEIENEKLLLQKNVLNRSQKNISLSSKNEELFKKGIMCFNMILRIRFEDDFALKQIISIYTQLCFFSQSDLYRCLQFTQEALLYAPNNETIHYNLGFIYQRLNKLELSIIHYKISLSFSKSIHEKCTQKGSEDNVKLKDETRRLILNNYNGISCIYRSIKQWPEALHYLLRAQDIDKMDPDVQNQLGVVYTEMRRTDLAEIAYNNAIKNYKRSFISSDHKFLLAELYLNLGHMHSYNGDNNKSIENYNKSLQVCPNFSLPFQNKIMNLTYLFDQLEDKKYIFNQHKLVNKLYKKNDVPFKFDAAFFNTKKINIGIISGDFVDHPVSFFISTFLKMFDTSKFTITCYSECVINTALFNKNLQLKMIKNYSAEAASKMIHEDNIHILFDLAGHTAFNRLDVFAMKPAPIQITYIGYPYSTGLDTMDYRITDDVCDGDFSVSQEFYTEKLLALKNCFLCYDPHVKETKVHELITRPKDEWINIGCFNRINKITDSVIEYFNDILLRSEKTRFIFKTKALINESVKNAFINKFKKLVRSRIIILDCTISHDDHLLTYNQVDFAIDTFPYSGTTTTCEALYMGVPVFSLYDSQYYFHAQNVSCSILKNSDLDFYVLDNKEELFEKIKILQGKDKDFWNNLKCDVRNKFLNGKVCNKELYMTNLQNLLMDVYKKCKET